jgi:hypothetical protein
MSVSQLLPCVVLLPPNAAAVEVAGSGGGVVGSAPQLQAQPSRLALEMAEIEGFR